MVTDLKQFADLKQKVEQAQQRADRAQGSIDQLLQQLKEEYKCDSIEEAEEVLTSLKEKEQITETEYTEALEEFQSKWKERL